MPRLFTLALSVASFYSMASHAVSHARGPNHSTASWNGGGFHLRTCPPNGTDIGETFQWRGLFPPERES